MVFYVGTINGQCTLFLMEYYRKLKINEERQSFNPATLMDYDMSVSDSCLLYLGRWPFPKKKKKDLSAFCILTTW